VLLGIREEIQAVTEPVWDDNELKVVNFFDFWIDPRGQCIDTARFAFQRERLTEEQVEDRLAVLSEAGLGTVFHPNWEELRGSSPVGCERHDLLTSVGITPETSEGPWSDDPRDQRRGNLHEVLHYWEDNRYAMLINRKELLYEGDSPYWRHQRKPFVVGVFERL